MLATRRAVIRRACTLSVVAATGGTLAVTAAPPASALIASTTSLHASASRVRVGTPVAFGVRLAMPLGGLAHQRVTLVDRTAGGSWHAVASAATDAHGDARFVLRPTRTAQWQVRYAGNLVWDASASPVRTVTVWRPLTFAQKVLREAARHQGAPYQYGAAGPDRFDCSGFTMYVFGRFGVDLPHNAAGQYDVVRHVPGSDIRPGDLVFFSGSGGIYHVGIYAGGGRMWAAPHTGDHVRLEAVYDGDVLVGRVG